jgi:hypothetical protein
MAGTRETVKSNSSLSKSNFSSVAGETFFPGTCLEETGNALLATADYCGAGNSAPQGETIAGRFAI